MKGAINNLDDSSCVDKYEVQVKPHGKNNNNPAAKYRGGNSLNQIPIGSARQGGQIVNTD